MSVSVCWREEEDRAGKASPVNQIGKDGIFRPRRIAFVKSWGGSEFKAVIRLYNEPAWATFSQKQTDKTEMTTKTQGRGESPGSFYRDSKRS